MASRVYDPMTVPPPDMGEEERQARRNVLTSRSLVNTQVRNTAGEDLGQVEEIMIDIASGSIAYAVLSFGGFLGIGNKLFAIPWQALTYNPREQNFTLEMDKQRLEKAPGFDKENWPDMANPAFSSQVHDYYGYRPYWERDR